MQTLPVSALLALALVAGCTTPAAEDVLATDSFRMSLAGLPATLAAGDVVEVTVQATAQSAHHEHASDHIGAHFWNSTAHGSTPSAATSTSCAHTGGTLPGTYRISCTAPTAPGEYYLRAHARITESDGTACNWWGDAIQFTVA